LSQQHGAFSGYQLNRQGPDMMITLNKLDNLTQTGTMEGFSNMGYEKYDDDDDDDYKNRVIVRIT
jgi:hypothetical protein